LTKTVFELREDYPLAHKDKDGWYSDGDYEARGGKMTHMHPDEYLKKVRPLKIDDSSRENIEDLKNHIKAGRKLDPLKIYADGKEDGRHRAHAAKELGIKKVPVVEFPRTIKEWIELTEMAPPHVERDEVVKRLIKHKLPIKRRESSKISDSEYLHVDVGDEHDEYGDKIGDKLIKVRISDHRATRHAIQKHGAAHVEIGPHGHSVDNGMKQILRHAGINEASGDCFKTAYRHSVAHGGDVVHAKVTNGGKTFHHAWVEKDGKVIDHSNGNQHEMPRDEYYKQAGVHTDSVKRYSSKDAMVKGIKAKHFGPWDINEKVIDTTVDTEVPKRSSAASKKFKAKKKPVERRAVKPTPEVINYQMLSNYSLAQRWRWGDRQAWEELERRHRKEAQEPEKPLEPEHPDAYQPHVHGIDQRLPKGVLKNQIGNKYDRKRKVDLESLKLSPETYEYNVRLTKDYPNMPKGTASLPTDQLAEKFIQHATDNLVWLHDQVPKEIRDRSKKWYDGANKLSQTIANKYGMPLASVVGVMAALSPQKDWYQNAALGERLIEYIKGPGNITSHKYDDKMDEVFLSRDAFQKPEYDALRKLLRGKSLNDIDGISDDDLVKARSVKKKKDGGERVEKEADQVELNEDSKAALKALWIHLYDRAYGNDQYPILGPEGDKLGPAQTPDGTPRQAKFMTLKTVATAIQSIEANGDLTKISSLMGDKHKVRNFFNNIYNPMSPDGDVTIDTHAVAAALMRPLSQSSIEVGHNFHSSLGKGSVNSKGSAKTGIAGTYPLYAEAYRRAAEKRGILPREMQSITWEAVRGLFPAKFKGRDEKGMQAIAQAWQRFHEGMYNENQIRKLILDMRGGKIPPPTWITGEVDEDEDPEAEEPDNRITESTRYSRDKRVILGPRVLREATTTADLRARIGTAGRASEPAERASEKVLNIIKGL
jgi:hypothetical protein